MKWIAVFLLILTLGACAEKPYPYPDIVQAFRARNNAILDQYAAGKITKTEAEALVAQARMEAISEENRRFSRDRQIRAYETDTVFRHIERTTDSFRYGPTTCITTGAITNCY